MGNRAYDQTDANSGSMIRAGLAPTDLASSLCGILGSPSFPYRPNPSPPSLPSAARAPFVVHSAGGDGIFLGVKDKGARQFWQPYVDYQAGFVNIQLVPHRDKDGKIETIDVIKAFDDIIATGGN